MKNVLNNFKGDRGLWMTIFLIAVVSFAPVFSASTNLVYVAGAASSPYAALFKHAMLLVLGFVIMYGVHKIPYRYFSGGSVILLPFVVLLLLYTLAQGTLIGGANASRWIRIPVVGVTFQTSTFASVVLMVYVARYLARNKDKIFDFKESFMYLWIPVALVLGLILPANFSTTAIVFMLILLLVFLGGYPVKQLGAIVGLGVVALAFFVLIAKAFPDAMPNRVDTWMSRIDDFSNDKVEGYQVTKAKIAIATGGLYGRGPGKSIQKNFLPQSSSDFIFAIIVEEFGLLGGLTTILLYIILLVRILVIAKSAKTIFGTLLVVGVGLPIIFQAMINMAVATNLFPVTGQTLPFISSGGTSIWMTCLSFGIILSISSAKNEILETKEQYIDPSLENPLEVLHETIG